MGRFDKKLKHLPLDGKTIEVEFRAMHDPSLCKDPPVLLLAHMGRANTAWWNARVSVTLAALSDEAAEAEAAKDKPDVVAKFQANAAKEAESMERNRELMPEFIVKGWRNVFNDEGIEEPFSIEAASDLLQSKTESGEYYVPDDIVLDWINQAADISRFRTIPTPTAKDAEVLSKNS